MREGRLAPSSAGEPKIENISFQPHMPYLLITHRVKQVPEVNVLSERLKFTSQMEPILASRVDQ